MRVKGSVTTAVCGALMVVIDEEEVESVGRGQDWSERLRRQDRPKLGREMVVVMAPFANEEAMCGPWGW